MMFFWFALTACASFMAGFLLACVLASSRDRDIAELTDQLEGSEEKLNRALRADAPGHKHHKGGA